VDYPYFPLHDFGPVMKGMVIGGVAIVHVFLAQFAIGAGIVLSYFQLRAMSGRNPLARQFVDGYFRWLALISFVLGALTGVSLWFTTIQVSPRTIGLMVDEFHWLWATEWTFFCLEVASGYAFYRYGTQLNDRARLALLVIYSIAAWMSLFWINGILSWQLTPGGWLDDHNVWRGFFNPTFWPSLVFRTVTSLAEAGLFACIVINFVVHWDREQKARMLHEAFRFLAPMALMPVLGVWYLSSVPADSRSWVLGGSVAMTMFLTLGIGASLLIGVYSIFMLLHRRMFMNGATAALLLCLAFGATAGGEFVREGIRKPFTVRNTLYANSITRDEVERMRSEGCVTHDPYPIAHAEGYPNDQLRLGARVMRMQCSVCHTTDGANGLVHLTHTWTIEQLRMNVAQLQHTKPFMPPFAGTPKELEALVQYCRWLSAGRPGQWDETTDDGVLQELGRLLAEAGPNPVQSAAQPATDPR
jgi:cytochrome d ubiquinol oxidase subunit I